MKPKKQLISEPQFTISLVVGESLVGPILRFIDNQATSVGIQIVKEVKEGTNFPRGAFKAAIIEILSVAKAHTIPFANLKEQLEKMGFSKAVIGTKLYQTRIRELYSRKGLNVVLKKGIV